MSTGPPPMPWAGGAVQLAIRAGPVTGTTSASNELNTANNGSTGSVAIIDALDDTTFGTVGSLAGGSTPSVLGNDEVGASPAASTGATPNVVLTANGAQGFTGTGTATPLTVNADGTITVPAGATPGSYTVPYRICSTATPAACDNATATVVVGAEPDMRSTVACTPNPAAVGATVSCAVTCSNIG